MEDLCSKGDKKIIIGYISKRPISIAALNMILDKLENIAKLPNGPHNPNPGPILPRHAKTEDIVVSISKLSKDTRRRQKAMMMM